MYYVFLGLTVTEINIKVHKQENKNHYKCNKKYIAKDGMPKNMKQMIYSEGKYTKCYPYI